MDEGISRLFPDNRNDFLTIQIYAITLQIHYQAIFRFHTSLSLYFLTQRFFCLLAEVVKNTNLYKL